VPGRRIDVALLATMGVIVRPWGLPEALWAVTGVVALVASSLLPLPPALHAVGSAAKGEPMPYLFQRRRSPHQLLYESRIDACRSASLDALIFLLADVRGVLGPTCMSF
jgi:hypothetical protein